MFTPGYSNGNDRHDKLNEYPKIKIIDDEYHVSCDNNKHGFTLYEIAKAINDIHYLDCVDDPNYYIHTLRFNGNRIDGSYNS